RDAQGVAIAVLDDIRDAGREHALLAGQFLVDEVGDAVRGQAQIRRVDRVALAAELDAFDDVPELESHIEWAGRAARHRAANERIDRTAAPLAHRRLAGLIE